MGNAKIPSTAADIKRDHGLFADGNRMDCTLWRHISRHGDTVTYWIEQTWPGDRHTRQFTGPRGREHALAEWADLVEVLRKSKQRTAQQPD
jgi:hypothetical protein